MIHIQILIDAYTTYFLKESTFKMSINFLPFLRLYYFQSYSISKTLFRKKPHYILDNCITHTDLTDIFLYTAMSSHSIII